MPTSMSRDRPKTLKALIAVMPPVFLFQWKFEPMTEDLHVSVLPGLKMVVPASVKVFCRWAFAVSDPLEHPAAILSMIVAVPRAVQFLT